MKQPGPNQHWSCVCSFQNVSLIRIRKAISLVLPAFDYLYDVPVGKVTHPAVHVERPPMVVERPPPARAGVHDEPDKLLEAGKRRR